jgi:hypothetical protein
MRPKLHLPGLGHANLRSLVYIYGTSVIMMFLGRLCCCTSVYFDWGELPVDSVGFNKLLVRA